ncbi:MAG: STAS domain-containing protein [Solirubrobacteraceae bacterium]
MSTTEPLSIRRSREGGIVRLVPVGELDLATVPILERAFDEAFGDLGAETIVVDLNELGFMDSTGLHLLLRMTAACEDSDRLRVVNGSSAVVRLLDLSGVRDALPIISSDRDPRAPLPSESRQHGEGG